MRPGGGRGRGVTALFAGDSGTGKTMSAEVIAAELGLDLYTVNLATVVDKYIGETEKNLERIFAEADGVNAVLLFDEADAIFGKRSEVRDAHDRYANIESAYLLQRMETLRRPGHPVDQPALQHRRGLHPAARHDHRLPGARREAPARHLGALPGAAGALPERPRPGLLRPRLHAVRRQHPVGGDHRRLPRRRRRRGDRRWRSSSRPCSRSTASWAGWCWSGSSDRTWPAVGVPTAIRRWGDGERQGLRPVRRAQRGDGRVLRGVPGLPAVDGRRPAGHGDGVPDRGGPHRATGARSGPTAGPSAHRDRRRHGCSPQPGDRQWSCPGRGADCRNHAGDPRLGRHPGGHASAGRVADRGDRRPVQRLEHRRRVHGGAPATPAVAGVPAGRGAADAECERRAGGPVPRGPRYAPAGRSLPPRSPGALRGRSGRHGPTADRADGATERRPARPDRRTGRRPGPRRSVGNPRGGGGQHRGQPGTPRRTPWIRPGAGGAVRIPATGGRRVPGRSGARPGHGDRAAAGTGTRGDPAAHGVGRRSRPAHHGHRDPGPERGSTARRRAVRGRAHPQPAARPGQRRGIPAGGDRQQAGSGPATDQPVRHRSRVDDALRVQPAGRRRGARRPRRGGAAPADHAACTGCGGQPPVHRDRLGRHARGGGRRFVRDHHVPTAARPATGGPAGAQRAARARHLVGRPRGDRRQPRRKPTSDGALECLRSGARDAFRVRSRHGGGRTGTDDGRSTAGVGAPDGGR